MKLIESKAEYIPQEEGLEGIYKQIELAGRTAYHSSPKYRYWTSDGKYFINEGAEDFKLLYNPEEYPIKQNISAEDFVQRMIKSKHGAALEHGTVYLKVPINIDVAGYYLDDIATWTKCHLVQEENPKDNWWAITTNYRVIIERGWLNHLQYLCSPTDFHEKRYTMRFTCDRGVSHQLVRERLMSFLQESQRYCSYIKEKFGASVTFIQPDWIKTSDQKEFEEDLKAVEQLYFKWLNKGYKAEEARYFLINGTKTEIVITAFTSDWRHMLDLRYFEKTGKVSPDMKDLMQKAQKAMQEAGIWEDIMNKPSKFD